MSSKKVKNNISGIAKLYITGITLVTLLVIGSFNSSEASAQTTLTRGPYLQSVTPTSILIVWETDEPTDSRVEYGLTSEYGSVESDSTPVTRHVVLLDGLASYTTYHYRVGTSTGALSEDSTLKTAGGSTQTQFNFAVYGDTETESETSQAIEQSVVDGIVSVSPDFCLHVGDVIHNIDQIDDWNTFFDTERDLMKTTTLFTTMGNHEQDHPNYFDYFYLPGNERWYSFNYGHAHFICLQVDTIADYSEGSEQYLWLVQDLAINTQPWIFVFFHVPPYSSSLHGSDTNVRAALQPLFDYYGVAIVFNGHDHCYERSIVNDVTYLETAGGGERLYEREEWNDWTVYFESVNHFVSIAIDGDILTGVGIRPDGSQFDSFSIEKSTTGENHPPFLYPIGDRSVIEEELLEFTISATDPDSDNLTYSADLSSLPPEASFNSTNRTFSWTPDVGEAGTYNNVHFEVSDGSLTDSEDITITVSTQALLPLRVNCAGDMYNDTSGNYWSADQAYVAGPWGFCGEDHTVDRGTGYDINGTEDDRIYQTERYGLDGYKFDLENGTYSVILHFAETYSGITEPGQRVFDVSIEGLLVLDHFDILKEVEHHTALIKVFDDIDVDDGQLNIDFTHVTERPEINGIEIVTAVPNYPPSAVDDTYNTDEDDTLVIAAPGVLANDTDANDDPITAILISDVSHGTLALESDGSFNYDPADGYMGIDSFAYQANDGTANSNTATVTIYVNCIDDRTLIVDDITLIPTYECIGIYAPFLGDINENNSAFLDYRTEGSGTWIRGMDMTPDRRYTVGSSSEPNPYRNQWRASILGLQPDTEYEVRVTFDDSDDVSGTNPVTSEVRTRNDNPPSNGNTYYVATDGDDSTGDGSEESPWRTIQQAVDVDNVADGDTVLVKAGTYTEGQEIIVESDGSPDNYITIRNFENDVVTINATDYTAGFQVLGSYIRIKGFEIIGGDYGILLGRGNIHDVIIEDNIIRDSKTLSSAPSLYHGIFIYGGNDYSIKNITIQGNDIYIVEPGGQQGDEKTSGPGITMYKANGGHVIRNNGIFFTGTTDVHGRDGINNQPNFEVEHTIRDTDIYGNYIKGATDDGISLDGNGCNVRVWKNTITRANLGISIAPVIIGPAYIFRNTIYDPERHWAGNAWLKGAEDSTGHVYCYHNTLVYDNLHVGTTEPDGSGKDSNNNYGLANWGGGIHSLNIFWLNNILETNGPITSSNEGYPVMDYDLLYNHFEGTKTYWAKWQDRFGDRTYSNEENMAEYQSGTCNLGDCQEVHGVAGQATFVNKAGKDFRLVSGSLGIDQGVVIYGFNDANSFWSYSGTAPDMGAHEYGSATPQPPSVTTNAATSVGANTTTLNGTVTDDGGEACDYRFEYDTDSGGSYDYNTDWTQGITTGQSFSETLTGLSPGITYYYRAQVSNSAGTVSGSEVTFTTTTEEIISVTIIDYDNNDVQFGTIVPGQENQPADWGASQGTVSIIVGGETNVNVNVQVKGADFLGPDAIDISNVKYNDTDSTTGATTLTDAYVTWYTVEQPLTTDNVTQVYYWLSIPVGQAAGSYESHFSYRVIKPEPE